MPSSDRMVATAISDDVCLFELIELAIERFFGRGVDHPGKISNAAGRLGKRLCEGQGS